MRTTLNRVAAGVAAAAVASLAILSSSASALPPGTAAAGTSVLAPGTGTNTSNFTLTPPSGAACPGDSSATPGNGYRWGTFFVASSVDPATLTYAAGLPVQQGSAYTDVLYNSAGSPQANKTTAASTGLITPLPVFNFGANVLPAPNGTYNIGYACTLAGVTERFWSTPITVSNSTATTFSYSFGAVPAAPVVAGTLVAGDQTLAGTFTHAASIPAATGYTVTAVPTVGPGTTATLPLAAGVTSFSFASLTNGTTYAVSIVATNTAGSSAASNTVTGIPTPAARPPVTNLQGDPLIGSVNLSWTAPSGVAPIGYTIAVTPTVAGAPFTAAAGATSFSVTGPAGLYTFTVTPNHASPYVGTSASVVASILDARVIIQDITVVRPAGALVLTQICGAYGPLDAEPASTGFPFMPATPGTTAGATGPTLLANGAGGVDPNYTSGSYPSPATPTYPTHCGINLGTATLVTTGPEAGQYYAAKGQINQVTVSDTRNGQQGWTVNGTMSDFVSSTNSSVIFKNQMGWTPVVNGTSIGQTVTKGAPVAPVTPGLAVASPLAVASNTASLGIAHMDARLRLLIPVAIPQGTYTATLTFSVV